MATFTGKNIVVTGSASGIGLAITLTLAERGAIVWTVDLSQNPPEELKPWIEKGKVHFEGGIDVGDRTTCRAYMDRVVFTAGRLDGLVNNAGIGLAEGPIASDEAYDRMIYVNIGGVWNYGTAALRAMQKQEPRGEWGSRGSIVNIASGAGLRGVSGLAVYCATKHAVIGLSRAWQEDFGKYGIRTNSVAPGATATAAFVKRAEEEKGFLDTLPSNPLGRVAKPSEIASAVAFLLSDEASYVAGEVLSVTGGHA
ncbi:uncharacterized protein Z519_11808 [Cladophialophora bantiana CBS 173.52]|uniref:Uncharacterized protein n=1 Tax=Cladophialophora bantiana (strain ATCC 10958 / CBS 173.52 / CDC B-1940 / NIH 8579) TaxID=1442370 RepID=A0A0D2H9D8_CLAB1|nr:uncharacterized protein Z519_11808 [Cladophialophora bantiana CBS 173.52]KIW87485.1 hypothetical protein Z519_11808 [Cladophialophora bantiana CBS 173.52]